ncbi:Uncharacterised protein [Bordetella pertussis]|nr:Uncharacterised protein [Bordetella pertussis]CFO98034.1 Uncharacterised protein [Bordetella pertussis]CFT94918.1 Uncharacterised protein [Bordetella pertussis]CPO09976.1 Uncharacterised protein [Bordetella pertussis]CPO39844.1 Uncharacterised protein [Bordetella pertussis]
MVWRAILREICAGQPKCSATQPSQAVAAVSEKHITANQSSVLTTPRRSVGSEKAPRMAQGTASMAYSASLGPSRNSSISAAVAASTSGTQIWGAYSQARQRQIASRASGQVGHRYQGRSRSVRPVMRRSGQSYEARVQVFQLRIQ